jgi:imidazolonepropionase-like amidohydrolase
MTFQPFQIILLFTALLLCSFTNSLAQPVVIQEVSVLTMESDQILTGHTLIIEDGVIQWIGPASEAEEPENAQIISGNYYVMPGLAEMHAHIPQPGQGEQAMKDALILYLSQGITTIRGMLGHPAHLELRVQAATDEIDSPRIFTSGPSFSGGSVESPSQAREMVNQQVTAGYDLLKFHPGLSVPEFRAITDEANHRGIEFSGHISHDVGLERSLDAGQGTIDHLDRYMEFLAGNPENREDPNIIFFGYDLAYDVEESRIAEAAELTAEAGVWNVPTHTLLHNVFNPDLTVDMMRNWPGMEYVSDLTLNNWSGYVQNLRNGDAYDADKARRFLEVRDELLLALHEAGAGIMLGADAPQIFNPPGFAAHRELELMIEAGLTPFEALKTGTVNVADYLDESGSSGVIAAGARADLMLLSANPLETVPFHDQIEGVISNGRYYSREYLNELLEGVRNRTN